MRWPGPVRLDLTQPPWRCLTGCFSSKWTETKSNFFTKLEHGVQKELFRLRFRYLKRCRKFNVHLKNGFLSIFVIISVWLRSHIILSKIIFFLHHQNRVGSNLKKNYMVWFNIFIQIYCFSLNFSHKTWTGTGPDTMKRASSSLLNVLKQFSTEYWILFATWFIYCDVMLKRFRVFKISCICNSVM